MNYKKKLIEVALPVEAINCENLKEANIDCNNHTIVCLLRTL